MRPALAGVVGEGQIGQRLLTQAGHDRVETSAVVRADARETEMVAGSAVCTAAETVSKDPDDWKSGGEPETAAQQSYLETLSQGAGGRPGR